MKAGRKKILINWDIVDNMLHAQCNGASIARLLGIHPDTLYNKCKEKYKVDFSAYAQQKKSEGQELLRAKQFDTAMSGNVTMQIWLGKQYLSQQDKVNLDHSGGLKVDYDDARNRLAKAIGAESVPGAKEKSDK